MEITTLLVAVGIMLATLGFDTVMHPRDIVLEAKSSIKLERVQVTDEMLNDILIDEVVLISSTPSIVTKPVIKMSNQNGVALSIADALNLAGVAYALQTQAGYQPDRIKIHLFSEDSAIKILVTGTGFRRYGIFQQEIVQGKGETIVGLARRAAVVAMARIDPYSTALNLMQRHTEDKDFRQCQAVIDFVLSKLLPTPINPERSMFENLQGIIALFSDDLPSANRQFQRAVASDPNNHPATLNLALGMLAGNRDAEAVMMLRELLAKDPPDDPILLAAAHVTLSAAYLGVDDLPSAEAAVVKALEIRPDNQAAYGLWAEIKRLRQDMKGVASMQEKARTMTDLTGGYAEVGVLYFRMVWENGEPVFKAPFGGMAGVGVMEATP